VTKATSKRVVPWVGGIILVIAIVGFTCARNYIKAHPIVFNESFFGHAHCMMQLGSALRLYASDHDGKYPSHTNGYGDALLLLPQEKLLDQGNLKILTGPGGDTKVFEDALKNHTDVDEGKCSRVYVQGLSENSDPKIAILFDKVASPGDHCNGLRRIRAPFRREVCMADGWVCVVPEREWPAFAKDQIERLVKAEISLAEAVRLYAPTLGLNSIQP
jgi:hypothetical protein